MTGVRAAALALLLGVVAGPVATETAAGPKTFSAKDVIEGTKVSREVCARTLRTVFVTSFGEGVCIRYYLSGAARGAKALVFFTGDVLGLDAEGRREVDPGYLTQAPEYIDIAARVWRERLGVPVIFFGRLGLNGSSGWHGDRRTALEVDVTRRALDAIAAKEGLAGFHLVGQSGGAMLLPPLIAARDDVGCAVIASGPLDFRAFTRAYGITFRETGPRAHWDPMADVPKVVAATGRADPTRLFLLTDPKDRAVPAVYQMPFALAVAQAGGRATVVRTEGRDADHHALIEKALFVAGDCIAGRSDDEIRRRWEGRAGNDLPQ